MYNSDQIVDKHGATTTKWFYQMIFKSYTPSHIFLINPNIAYDLVNSAQAWFGTWSGWRGWRWASFFYCLVLKERNGLADGFHVVIQPIITTILSRTTNNNIETTWRVEQRAEKKPSGWFLWSLGQGVEFWREKNTPITYRCTSGWDRTMIWSWSTSPWFTKLTMLTSVSGSRVKIP